MESTSSPTPGSGPHRFRVAGVAYDLDLPAGEITLTPLLTTATTTAAAPEAPLE